jgi:glycine dehydrogenase
MSSIAVRHLLTKRTACSLLGGRANTARIALSSSRLATKTTTAKFQQVRTFLKSSSGDNTSGTQSSSIFDPLDTFQRRHVGPSPAQTEKMLEYLKYDSLDTFVRDVVPANILSARDLKVSPTNGLSETELLERIGKIAAENKSARSYIGCGYTGTKTPTVIARNILECPEWYTSYTPYQPEISQGMFLLLLCSWRVLAACGVCWRPSGVFGCFWQLLVITGDHRWPLAVFGKLFGGVTS